MDNQDLKDQEARDAIEGDLSHNMVVMAGAGAGKTHALTGRMVRMVAGGAIDIEHIAAITFTRKAAGELRGRFYARLREAMSAATADERSHIARALEAFDQCFVGTIHSFCGRLLRERPVEAGLTPDFTEIEERDETVIRRAAWDRFLQTCTEADDPRLRELEELGVEPEDLYLFFTTRCRYNDLPLKETRVDPPEMTDAFVQACDLIDKALKHIPAEPPKGRDGFMTMVERANRFLENREIQKSSDRVRLLKMLAGKPDIKVTYWGEERPYASDLLKLQVPAFQKNVLEPALREWRQYTYSRVAPFVDEAMGFYDAERHRASVLTFQDLLVKAAGLLRDYPSVRRFFQKRFRHLLIDEFQDTDPIQAEVVFYLAGDDPTEKDWRNLSPRPGSLFIVGDDKQSIYRFRRADIDVFRFVAQRIKASGGRRLSLSTSFRSLDGLCDWVNSSFEVLGNNRVPEYQAAFTPLQKYRGDGPDVTCVRKVTIEKINRDGRAEAAAVSAERVADFIASATDTPSGEGLGRIQGASCPILSASPGDFLILTRTRGQLATYASALEARAIPYDIAGGNRLGDNAYVQALTDMLEAAIWPDNPIPFLCYLRGPFVGLGDDQLYAYYASGRRFDRHDPPSEAIDADTRHRVSEALARLRKATDRMVNKTPAAAIEQILDELGVVPFVVSAPSGSSNAGSLVRVLALVYAWENRGMHIGQIVAELRELVEDRAYNTEEMTLEAGADDVVRLMNIHQAKGLEGRVVFLCDPLDTSAGRFGVDCHVSRAAPTPYLALPVFRPKGEYHTECIAEPAGWGEDAEEEERFLRAENLRLLYVAATRARDMLVVCRYAGSDDKGPWTPFYPFLKNVPELQTGKAPPHVRTDTSVSVWEELEKERLARWEHIKKKTHTLTAVTAEIADRVFLPSHGSGKGKDYGVLVHSVFEAAVSGRLPKDEKVFVGALLEEGAAGAENMAEGWLTDVLAALKTFRASPLWEEINQSDRVFTEIPFGVSSQEDDTPTLLRGQIDLIYRTDRGWKMIDYKSDAAMNDDAAAALAKKYAPQIEAYARHWSRLTGEAVMEKGLWLTELGIYRRMP